MNYNTYPYGIFNPQYLSQFQTQQMEAQRNLEQQKNIYDMVKAISDFCEAARKAAMNCCLAEILRQAAIDNGGNRT
jgi:hypothetical protein